MPRMVAALARRAIGADNASTSVRPIDSARTAPRCANVKMGANAIRFPGNVTAHLDSLDRYVLRDVRRVSTVNSVARIVGVRMAEAVILKRVSVFVQPGIPDQYVLIAARAKDMDCDASKSVSVSTVQIVIT